MKTENQFTPGPWQVDDCRDAHGFTTIRRADRTPHGNLKEQPISTVFEDGDASLISAAPDLLAALENLLSEFKSRTALIESCDMDPDEESAMDAAEEAIAKARGQQ